MNTRTLTGVAAVLVAAAAPSMAYHIDGILVDGNTLGAGDFEPATCLPDLFCLTICESEFGAGWDQTTMTSGNTPTAIAADDRNSNGRGNPGAGGLCTTGRNDATGEFELVGTDRPDVSDEVFTLLDLCDVPHSVRGLNAACGGGGLTTTLGFLAEVGTYVCPVLPGQLLAYDEFYVAVTFDGDGSYTAGDAPGAVHTGDALNNDPPGSDKYQAWSGHVTVYVDPTTLPVGFTAGSVETSDPPAGYFAGVTALGNCGASPAYNPVGGGLSLKGNPYGPVAVVTP